MLYTCTTVTEFPVGVKFYLTEFGVMTEPPEDGEFVLLAETDRVFPPNTEIYVDSASRTVSDVCPPGLVKMTLTRDEMINDAFWSLR